MTTARRLALFALLALSAAAPIACGPYTLKGRVVRGEFSTIELVEPDDPRLEGKPLGGATVTIVRDAGRLNRAEVGSSSSDAEGDFALAVDAFGAGVTDETWLITASRSGHIGTDTTLRLPMSAGGTRLLITLARGSNASDRQGDASSPSAWDARTGTLRDEVLRDIDRFGR